MHVHYYNNPGHNGCECCPYTLHVVLGDVEKTLGRHGSVKISVMIQVDLFPDNLSTKTHLLALRFWFKWLKPVQWLSEPTFSGPLINKEQLNWLPFAWWECFVWCGPCSENDTLFVYTEIFIFPFVVFRITHNWCVSCIYVCVHTSRVAIVVLMLYVC